MPAADALTRFSNRVNDYVRYRPGYPPAMLKSLVGEFGLRAEHVVVDIGSGTGISAEVFLKNDNRVIAVEPNAEMRSAAEEILAKFAGFQSVAGTAEATTLPDRCADWAVAAQAFHWFDVDCCRAEFARILKPAGRVALIWNDRRDDTPFLVEYQKLLYAFATDYAAVDHRQVESDGRIDRFFAPTGCQRRVFDNVQVVDYEGLKGRLLSSSYVPSAGQPGHDDMLRALRALFDRFAQEGAVRLEYRTKLFVSGG